MGGNIKPYYQFASITIIDVLGGDLEENIFGVGASIELKSLHIHQLLKNYLFFRKLYILPFVCAYPLAWWCIHESQFLTMCFLAKHILEILSSQIKIKCVLSFVGMLIALKHYPLQVKTMNQIIIVHMNWLDDLGFNCKLNSNFKFF